MLGELPWGSIVTGGATVVAVVIANRLSFRRTSSEKIWDLRRQAYGEILSALAKVENVLDIAGEYIHESEVRYFEEGVSKLHDSRISESMDIARKRFDDEYLVLSPRFISCFDKMQKELSALGNDPDQTPDESHAEFDAVIRKHRPLLLTLARSEILDAKTT